MGQQGGAGVRFGQGGVRAVGDFGRGGTCLRGFRQAGRDEFAQVVWDAVQVGVVVGDAIGEQFGLAFAEGGRPVAA
ncbi:hypothetical protein DZF91_07640 [Actinomadura logoneensis]|uniref:Uncharacterized protein n=1 Tax=Actinomadura logoneensis TaxID=2293572 RepID=A0A372JQB3_9ACTN|nr:hypothetical protein DZF91_07640 [Actinomadura logoneensis]